MTYDVIIVGAGASGAPLAARLSEGGRRRVLLLEAGPDVAGLDDYPAALKDPGSMRGATPGHPANWSFVGNLTPQLPYSIARGRIVGGSTAINATYFIRGRREDFDRFAALGNDEWSYERVLPFFRRAERDLDFPDDPLHGAGGAMPVHRALEDPHPLVEAFYAAAAELGFVEERDKNAQATPGYGPIPVNVENGIRVNTSFAYLNPARGRSNLAVQGDSFVRRVVFEGTQAVGVEVEHRGTTAVVRGAEIVLCAGAVKSPHILMLSGIGPRAELEAQGIEVLVERPGVGKGFTDHPDIGVGYRVTRGVPWSVSGDAIQAALNFTATGSPFQGGDLEIIQTLKPLGAWVLGARPTDPRAVWSLVRRSRGRGLKGVSLRRLAQQISHRRDFALLAAVQQPVGRGEMSLRSPDPHVQPRLDYCYLEHADDLRRMREAVRTAVRLLRTNAYRPYVRRIGEPSDHVLASDELLDGWMRSHLATAIHASSSARMGPAEDPASVVDQYGRVHGVAGLRVADTSILPTVVSRGPAATAVMIGERMAELVEHTPAGRSGSMAASMGSNLP